MEFIYAAWPALVCFGIMLVLFIMTFRLARRYDADFISVLGRLIRSLPHHWRMLRDPAYRRKFRCIKRYETGLIEMVTAISARNTLAAISDDLLGQAYGIPADRASLLRQRIERNMTDEFEKARNAMAEQLAAVTEEEIAILAAYLRDEWYEGRMDIQPIEAWLRGERELAARSPFMIATHLTRAPRLKGLPTDGG